MFESIQGNDLQMLGICAAIALGSSIIYVYLLTQIDMQLEKKYGVERELAHASLTIIIAAIIPAVATAYGSDLLVGTDKSLLVFFNFLIWIPFVGAIFIYHRTPGRWQHNHPG